MSYIFALVFWLLNPAITDDEIESLRASAPTYLTTQTATEHLIAADAAAKRYRVDRNLILSIAHHESHYAFTTITPEAGGKVSCGVMTAEPTTHAGCAAATASLEVSYLIGAKHLRGWLDATKTQRLALLGYAGGWRLIRACALGPVWRQGGNRADLCTIVDVFQYRARLIGRGRVGS